MPRDVTRIASLSVELASYTSTFTARGLTLAGEQRSNGTYVVTATVGARLVGVAEDRGVKAAVNALAGQVGIPGSPAFP